MVFWERPVIPPVNEPTTAVSDLTPFLRMDFSQSKYRQGLVDEQMPLDLLLDEELHQSDWLASHSGFHQRDLMEQLFSDSME